MAYERGIAALNLEMTDSVPRTEYSADNHWDLVTAVTGIQVDACSEKSLQRQASAAFRKAWNYDFCWSILVHNQIFGDLYTKMGHAVYASAGTDFSSDITSPFSDPDDVLAFDPLTAYGEVDHRTWVNNFESHYAANCAATPDAVNMTGIYTTCMSGLIEMFGWELLLAAAGTDPVQFGHVTNRYALYIQKYFNALADASVPVVMVHDDIVWNEGAFLNPDWYRQYIFPNYRNYFAPLIESGKKIIFTSDGNYNAFIDDIAACGVHGFVMEPTTDMKHIAEKYGRTHAFIGNADTRILLSGSKDAIYDEVKRCMDIGKAYPGFFMAVGNHIPSNTPVENALYYNEVYRKLSRR